ncbi:Dihydroorotate dehydrogenase [Hirschfeldia incana]|nr:Dihydroorotate dehydrogenase [Hirschfeldia incana]
MQTPFLHLCKSFTPSSPLPRQTNNNQCFGLHNPLISTSISRRRIVAQQSYKPNDRPGNKGKVTLKGNKENIWSVDNDTAENENRKRKPKGKKQRSKRLGSGGGKKGRILISGTMLIESETVLQTQEPVIKPMWRTFASSVSGIWKGVGAVFSPITAEMEPLEIGKKNEFLYDCYTLSRIEEASLPSEIQRRINWVTLNPHGEFFQNDDVSLVDDGDTTLLPKFESFDLKASDVMEEDSMGDESGLVYFEDGSYSRGPVSIPVGEMSESGSYLTPTFKFEQCLVKGCHKRLRVVHTIEFANGGADIQIMRVGVYEEQWVCPSNYEDQSNNDAPLELKPFSQRKRTQPSELTGSWKVFEVSATPIYGEEEEEMKLMLGESSDITPYVYLCTEALKRRNLPESWVSFGDEEMVDMQDVSVMWLPGGVTAYVDVKKDGVLCVGIGWYSDEGINLVMERDYGIDGNLKEVRSKSEVKRRWAEEPK